MRHLFKQFNIPAAPVVVTLLVVGIFITTVVLLAHPADRGRSADVNGLTTPNPYYLTGQCSGAPHELCDPTGAACTSGTCLTGACIISGWLCDVSNPSSCAGSDICANGRCSISGKRCHTGIPATCDSATDGICQGAFRPLLPDLDNCPGGPFSRPCFDNFGIQIACTNADQADEDLDLFGDICDNCGNETVESALGEQCDDGTDNGVVCSANYGETCQYCSRACRLVDEDGGSCGDGIRQDSQEVCDGSDGTPANASCQGNCQGWSCSSGYYLDSGTNTCSPLIFACGNGTVDINPVDPNDSRNEVCDDAGNNGQPGWCASDCQSLTLALVHDGKLEDKYRFYLDGQLIFGEPLIGDRWRGNGDVTILTNTSLQPGSQHAVALIHLNDWYVSQAASLQIYSYTISQTVPLLVTGGNDPQCTLASTDTWKAQPIEQWWRTGQDPSCCQVGLDCSVDEADFSANPEELGGVGVYGSCLGSCPTGQSARGDQNCIVVDFAKCDAQFGTSWKNVGFNDSAWPNAGVVGNISWDPQSGTCFNRAGNSGFDVHAGCLRKEFTIPNLP